jgi:hypothetical protein
VDRLTLGEVVELMECLEDLPQDIAEQRSSSREVAGRETFAQLNETLREDQRFEKVGSTQRPAPADIYRTEELSEDYRW